MSNNDNNNINLANEEQHTVVINTRAFRKENQALTLCSETGLPLL